MELSTAERVTLDGEGFIALVQAGTAWLERNASAVDALNVFPVPDGDTGTNMLLTMRAAAEGARKGRGKGAGAVMKLASQGAVMGARGNSGVILSQIVAGISRGLADRDTCDGAVLATALAEGAAAAYRAVTRPVEGTILTVARAAGEGAVAAAGGDQSAVSCAQVLEGAHAAARQAVERTPDLLPVLRQAGVVDAGGEGYRVILEGMALAASGRQLPDAVTTTALLAEPTTSSGASGPTATAAGELQPPGEEWGYCTQFVIRGEDLDIDHLRQELQEIAESTLVVGDDSVVVVHGHTEDPGSLLTYATRYGRLQRVSVDDMDAQHDAWLKEKVTSEDAPTGDGQGTSAPPAGRAEGATRTEVALATVAVAPGTGLADVFLSLGTGEIVPGGQSMNPSAGELLDAARRTGAAAVILLPNNGNVVSTAEHAIGVAGDEPPHLFVVPTRTVPQGIAAQLAYRPEAPPDENVEDMTRAAAAVRTVEITRATRSVTIDDLQVNAGDVLGLLDDKVVAAAPDAETAAGRALELASAGKAELITVYRGDSATEAEAQAFVGLLRTRYPDAEVELHFGGQPHYDYMISVE